MEIWKGKLGNLGMEIWDWGWRFGKLGMWIQDDPNFSPTCLGLLWNIPEQILGKGSWGKVGNSRKSQNFLIPCDFSKKTPGMALIPFPSGNPRGKNPKSGEFSSFSPQKTPTTTTKSGILEEGKIREWFFPLGMGILGKEGKKGGGKEFNLFLFIFVKIRNKKELYFDSSFASHLHMEMCLLGHSQSRIPDFRNSKKFPGREENMEKKSD